MTFILAKCENEIVIEKSRFVAYYFEVKTPQQAKDIVARLKSEHKKCTHICWAYVCKSEGVFEKYCDDGEPSQTAGRPILNVIKKQNLFDCMICVVRYFGGIKLGVGGLVRAYTKSASEVLKVFKGGK